MRELVLTPGFRRAFRKFVRRDKRLQAYVEATLVQMQVDVYAPNLGMHKLSGELSGLWACACGYDCRIVFMFDEDPQTGQEVILLLDIGTHDEVY